MKTLLLAVICTAVAVAASAESLESARAASALTPSAAALGALKFKPAAVAAPAKEPKASEKSDKAQTLLRASGFLTLNGSGMLTGSNYVSIPVSGWVNLTEDSGAPISGGVYMNGTAWVSVNGSWASGWVTPQAYVTLTENGRALGTMLVQGNISVNGFVNGSWLNVSGSGYVSGQMWVDRP
jgi:hypothetical protein